MEKGTLEGNERIGLITFVMNDNAAANYRDLPLKVSSASAPKHIYSLGKGSNAMHGWQLIHFIPGGCCRMLDICMNKSQKGLWLGLVQYFMRPYGMVVVIFSGIAVTYHRHYLQCVPSCQPS